jgi:hypothetical protein
LKACSKCGAVKPLDQFHRFANARDGRRAECKTCALARAKANYDAKLRPTFDTGIRQLSCRHCKQPFEYVKTTGPRRYYCSEMCKYQAGEAAKKARAQVTQRTCACGSTDVSRVGKPVCPNCRKDRRPTEQSVARERRRTLRKYGLTDDDWARMVARQDNRCAICRTDKPGGRGELWHIDHDHVTGRVRGLLCHGCNVGIGNFRDDPDLMLAAVEYIRSSRADAVKPRRRNRVALWPRSATVAAPQSAVSNRIGVLDGS